MDLSSMNLSMVLHGIQVRSPNHYISLAPFKNPLGKCLLLHPMARKPIDYFSQEGLPFVCPESTVQHLHWLTQIFMLWKRGGGVILSHHFPYTIHNCTNFMIPPHLFSMLKLFCFLDVPVPWSSNIFLRGLVRAACQVDFCSFSMALCLHTAKHIQSHDGDGGKLEDTGISQ